MTKTFRFIGMVLMAVLVSVGFAACSDDDDNSGFEKEAKMFVGTWRGYGTWTFNEDGTCEYSYNDSYTGTWSYNEEAKTLITTILTWNWQVLNITEDSWTGTHLAGKGSTFTYTRVE